VFRLLMIPGFTRSHRLASGATQWVLPRRDPILCAAYARAPWSTVVNGALISPWEPWARNGTCADLLFPSPRG
jgi:hypothetical protein